MAEVMVGSKARRLLGLRRREQGDVEGAVAVGLRSGRRGRRQGLRRQAGVAVGINARCSRPRGAAPRSTGL